MAGLRAIADPLADGEAIEQAITPAGMGQQAEMGQQTHILAAGSLNSQGTDHGTTSILLELTTCFAISLNYCCCSCQMPFAHGTSVVRHL